MLTQTQIERWLQADLGHHDVTNDLPGDTTGRLVAGASGVAAGLEAAARVFEYLGCTATCEAAAGDAVESGETVLRASGPTRAVLRGERVATNVVSHASGVATRTHRAVTAATAAAPAVRVAATRKTTPGLRGLEKRAVAAAGGDTHRLNLSRLSSSKTIISPSSGSRRRPSGSATASRSLRPSRWRLNSR
ncbi:MAG: nicotinate-nucleotide pyrophosphorylase [halophilic archaeon J07HX5]|jgi:nicotinate-nucleotide pyrophosphorylase [carboxylating] (EC 2.4.2.19)|nr:MAG: nicotinate-nucleotide pyrophosphorylase [halophilic archaeon J07HX5]